ADDGVQEVPAGGGAVALPGGACRAASGVPAAAMEPVGGCPVPGRGGVAAAALRLRRGPEVEVRMPRSTRAPNPRKGDAMGNGIRGAGPSLRGWRRRGSVPPNDAPDASGTGGTRLFWG